MSKLSKSIMRSIEGGKKRASQADTKSESPFDQADQSAIENGLEYSVLSRDRADAETDSTESPEIERSTKPQKIKPVTTKKSTAKIFGVAALMVSALSAGIAGFTLLKQKSLRNELTVRTESADQAFAQLNQQFDETTLRIGKTQEIVGATSERLADLNGIRSEFRELQSQVSGMQSEIHNIKSQISDGTRQIDLAQSQIRELESALKKPRPVAKAVNHPPAKTSQSVRTTARPNNIEGAQIESIDSWGAQTFVMLKDSLGNWIPLRAGDHYQGWRLVSSSDSEAKFSKGSQTRTIAVQE